MTASCSNTFRDKTEKLLGDAEKLKIDGNLFYKRNELKKAIRCYHYALLNVKDIGATRESFLTSMFPGCESGLSGDALASAAREAVTKLQCDCYNNLAACLLKEEQPNYEKVVTYSEKVLARQPDNVKAVFRLGLARYGLRDYDRAAEAFDRAKKAHEACRTNPDPSIARYLSLCQQKGRLQDERLKRTYRNMFAGSGDRAADVTSNPDIVGIASNEWEIDNS